MENFTPGNDRQEELSLGNLKPIIPTGETQIGRAHV